MFIRIFLILIFLSFHGAGTPPKIKAQTNPIDVAGTVVDSDGHPLAQATVVLTNRTTLEERKTKTDSSGDFSFHSVPEGPYSLKAEWPRLASLELKLEVSTEAVTGIKIRMYRPVAAMALPPPDETPNYYKMKVFYATDRSATGSNDATSFYGSDRDPNEVLSMGTCDVSIPRDHRPGELEAPSIWKLEFREDPEKHVVLLGVHPELQSQFFSELASSISASPKKEALVFIHGYKTTFEDAARRTAQLAYDLNFQGAPIFYSWPSKGDLHGYAADEGTITWTTPHLMTFLKQVASQSNAKTLHLIAHSMGNRALTQALANLATTARDPVRPHFHEIILAAPDVDRGVFKQLAVEVANSADRVTLYASSHDEALKASMRLHEFPRAGEAGNGLLILKGIDTIDVSAIDSSLLGHSYFGDNTSVISDIRRLLTEGAPPNQRTCLSEASLLNLTYWVFTRESCTPQ